MPPAMGGGHPMNLRGFISYEGSGAEQVPH
jgi:hypothetical protein